MPAKSYPTPVPKNAVGHKVWVVVFIEREDQVEPGRLFGLDVSRVRGKEVTDAWPVVFRAEKAARKMNEEHPGTLIYESEVQ